MNKTAAVLLSACALAGSAWSQTNADNTANNARDKSGQTLTATDQSNAPADIKLTAEIRKLVVADKSLSALAKNVKIITVDQVVTLRGPVKSAAEKSTIGALAEKAGATKVINELEIK